MNSWYSHELMDRISMLQGVSEARGLPDYSVEKDWWMTNVLHALFQTEIGPFCRFKGGSSLSKGWSLIGRFSEDVDVALSPSFFNLSIDNNTQLKKLRKTCHKYLVENIPAQLTAALKNMNIGDFFVEAETMLHGTPISSDADPTLINVEYVSLVDKQSEYVQPKVKVEISCLSMEEPSTIKRLKTMIGEHYPGVDGDSEFDVLTVHPSRTFLEKAFLLCEEFQKDEPRSLRMSRHLYDLECIMDTEFGVEALRDTELYRNTVEHRRKFYHVGYADYDKDYPSQISFCPPERCSSKYEQDYNALLNSFVSGQSLTYQELLTRIRDLEQRFRKISVDEPRHI